MEIQPAEDQPKSPYSFESMLQNAAVSIHAARKAEPVGIPIEIVEDGKKVVIDTSKSAGSYKAYTMEEAKSLEIVPFNDNNPFGELDQDFAGHFKDMVASSEAIQAEKKRMGNALTVGVAASTDYTVKDLVKAFRKDENAGAISAGTPRQSPQGRGQVHQELPKSGE
jgi:hypothetical protein